MNVHHKIKHDLELYARLYADVEPTFVKQRQNNVDVTLYPPSRLQGKESLHQYTINLSIRPLRYA